MSTYRQKLETQIVTELRQWLDGIEEHYGPTFALEAYAFVGAVGFTPDGEEVADDESFARSAVGYHCSDSRHWAQVGILRQALLMAESNDED
jgi:hypothetical protein